MTQSDTVQSLEAAMAAEIACFESYVEAQRSFLAAMKSRDWQALEEAMCVEDQISRDLAEREAIRAEAFEKLRAECCCADSSLYRLALCVPEPERTKLTDLFRKLKLAAMRARFGNASASDYAIENRQLLKAVLEEIFPEKRHRNYGRSGRAIQPDLDAILLNTTL